MKFGFIGVGKMGGAILKGLLESGSISREKTYINGRDLEKTRKQAHDLNIKALETKMELVRFTDVIFIGVEPKTFPEVMPLVAKGYTPDKIIISMAAGVTLESIESYLCEGAKVVRIMPNAPARVGEIMASVSPNRNVTPEETDMVVKLLSGMGEAAVVPEELISAVIGVSGSSPAYTYMYIKALAESAEKYGMEKDTALKFAAQAVLGAAKIVLEECVSEGGEPPQSDIDTLIDNVCTPGGTTIEAVKSLNENGFDEIVRKGAEAAIERSIEMSRRQ